MDLEKIINNNELIEIKKYYLLKKEEIDILNHYKINYQLNSLKELIYIIDNYLSDCEDDEDYEILDNLLNNLQERDYYQNTNK